MIGKRTILDWVQCSQTTWFIMLCNHCEKVFYFQLLGNPGEKTNQRNDTDLAI